jgi:protein gp37
MKPVLMEPARLSDLTDLMEREQRIERAQRNAYYEIGLDLKAIRDRGLYKIARPDRVNGRYSFQTFEEYCEQRWELKRQRAYELIEAASVTEELSEISDILPTRESHVRPLVERLESDDERIAAWQQIIGEAPDRITARLVDEGVTRYIAARDKEFYTLAEWQALESTDRETALRYHGNRKFNAQDGQEERDTQKIEWAQWSWNPVTGCRHNCPYCYARDIANRFYPMQFEPAFWYKRLTDPANTSVPAKAETDVSFKNVFTCSMADLFGRWVPTAWIEAVLEQVASNPQWNFLFLTKFAARLTEFSFPANAWVGTTVDCQARVKAAEEAFARVKASVKWLSVEPMIEPLTFQHLDRFDWIVIGGASRSTQTPEWHVPIEWWAPLYHEAANLGLSIYLKSNLYERARGYPGMPWKAAQTPGSFIYLKTKTKDDIVLGEKS